MQGETYYSKAIEVKNPFLPCGVSKIITGLTTLFFSIPTLLNVQELFKELLAPQNSEGYARPLFGIAVCGILGIFWFLGGVKSTLLGVRNLGRLVVPPNTPPDFSDYREVELALLKREMPIYRMPSSGPIALARRFISDKVPFLTDRTRRVVEINISFVTKLITFVIVVLGANYV